MESFFLLVMVGFTSVCAYLVGLTGSKLSATTLRLALGRTLECIGLTLVFVVVNVLVGILAALGARILMSRFVPLYLAGDVTLLGLSLLQAMTYQWWRELSKFPRRQKCRM